MYLAFSRLMSFTAICSFPLVPAKVVSHFPQSEARFVLLLRYSVEDLHDLQEHLVTHDALEALLQLALLI